MRSELIFLCIEPKHFVMLSCPSIDTVEICRGQVMNRILDKLYSRSSRSTDQSGGHFPGAQVYNLDQQPGRWYKFDTCDKRYHSKEVLEEASAVTPLTPQLHYGKDSESKIKSYLRDKDSNWCHIMLKILQARLQQYVNCELPDVQAAFRKDRGTRDQIANILWIIEKAIRVSEKHLFLPY